MRCLRSPSFKIASFDVCSFTDKTLPYSLRSPSNSRIARKPSALFLNKAVYEPSTIFEVLLIVPKLSSSGSESLITLSKLKPDTSTVIWRSRRAFVIREGSVVVGAITEIRPTSLALIDIFWTNKMNIDREIEALEWMSSVLGERIEGPAAVTLKDGVNLVHLINKLAVGPHIKVSTSKLMFHQMGNTSQVLAAAKSMGVRDFESFQTVDLYESKNIEQVISSLYAISRCASAHGYTGPTLGPKLAQSNERTFTNAQMLMSKSAVPLLKGFVGASQKGYMMSAKREIGGSTTTLI